VASYSFRTTWVLDAERERVWDAIYCSEHWPEWWPGCVATTRIADGDANGIGQRGSYEWRARLPYTVRFEITSTRVERPVLLAGCATGGLVGEGVWRFFSDDDETAVVYDWNVESGKRWMRALGPVAAPVFRANHDGVMSRGGEGLARYLGARLIRGRDG
jgi:hypothetical protein